MKKLIIRLTPPSLFSFVQVSQSESTVIKVTALVACAVFSFGAGALSVITHVDNTMTFNKQQIRDVFMGAAPKLKLIPVVLPISEPVRLQFNIKVVGLTESRIQSYWAQMRFSGHMKPPRELKSEADVLDFVSANPEAIAYVSADTKLPAGVKTVFVLDQ